MTSTPVSEAAVDTIALDERDFTKQYHHMCRRVGDNIIVGDVVSTRLWSHIGNQFVRRVIARSVSKWLQQLVFHTVAIRRQNALLSQAEHEAVHACMNALHWTLTNNLLLSVSSLSISVEDQRASLAANVARVRQEAIVVANGEEHAEIRALRNGLRALQRVCEVVIAAAAADDDDGADEVFTICLGTNKAQMTHPSMRDPLSGMHSRFLDVKVPIMELHEHLVEEMSARSLHSGLARALSVKRWFTRYAQRAHAVSTLLANDLRQREVATAVPSSLAGLQVCRQSSASHGRALQDGFEDRFKVPEFEHIYSVHGPLIVLKKRLPDEPSVSVQVCKVVEDVIQQGELFPGLIRAELLLYPIGCVSSAASVKRMRCDDRSGSGGAELDVAAEGASSERYAESPVVAAVEALHVVTEALRADHRTLGTLMQAVDDGLRNRSFVIALGALVDNAETSVAHRQQSLQRTAGVVRKIVRMCNDKSARLSYGRAPVWKTSVRGVAVWGDQTDFLVLQSQVGECIKRMETDGARYERIWYASRQSRMRAHRRFDDERGRDVDDDLRRTLTVHATPL